MLSEGPASAIPPLIIGGLVPPGHRWQRPSKCPAATSSSRMAWREDQGSWKVTLRSSIRILLPGIYNRVGDQRPEAAT